MSVEVHFAIVFLCFASYVAVGNYVYWVKVLPTLRAAGKRHLPVFLPSGQSAQMKECQRILAERGDLGLAYWFLRLSTVLIVILVVLAATVVFRAVVR